MMISHYFFLFLSPCLSPRTAETSLEKVTSPINPVRWNAFYSPASCGSTSPGFGYVSVLLLLFSCRDIAIIAQYFQCGLPKMLNASNGRSCDCFHVWFSSSCSVGRFFQVTEDRYSWAHRWRASHKILKRFSVRLSDGHLYPRRRYLRTTLPWRFDLNVSWRRQLSEKCVTYTLTKRKVDNNQC